MQRNFVVSNLNIIVDGEPRIVAPGTCAHELFTNTVVVARLNGELVDLTQEVHDGDQVAGVELSSPEGLAVLRHSAAHVLAQAVQQINPQARLGIGPPIKDGFYYDFDVETPFTPADLKALEKAMMRIIKEGQRFERVEVSDQEAIAAMAGEPYKQELISLKSGAHDADGAAVEVGEGTLTLYRNVRRDGSVAWQDLCRGPHLPTTKFIGNGFSLLRSAAAYWRGNETQPQLQRIYGTAWPSKAELQDHLHRLAEAERRDHRKLGNELDLFSFPDEIGSGLVVFHPNGGMIRLLMEDYSRRRHLASGYSFVTTPHVTKSQLFKTSGHLDWYADGMYPPMHMDAEYNEDGTVRKPGQDYYLKPMNCPMHNLIYRSRGRSYRELPLRLFEFGTVYRNEKSGVVHGLTRARGFTQDDAHIYCTREQMKAELASLLRFVLELLSDYGLEDFYLELSTKNPEKFVGDDETWDEATEILADVARESGLELVADPGGAAFYGPKVSVQAKDAIGRSWQMSTIQLDFNLPELFDLEYTAADGTRRRPVMIHRALFGSIERFFGVLTEHYAGAFPAWLAPVQVLAVPVAEPFNEYVQKLVSQLSASGIRAEADLGDDRFGKKIRNAATRKVPIVLIAGGDDVEAGAVSFRFRDGTQENGVPIQLALERIADLTAGPQR